MATYTITTAVNIDTLAAKVGSDTYNINGGYLTIDQHSRHGVNQNTSAALGNITLSASLGGTIEINATKVRLIAYSSGTGNVPALDTVISQGSASGKLLGVYSALNVAPTAAAAAMPATGFILIRQWNSVAYTAAALTGIGATATAADRAGWLEIVGAESLTITGNRLNTILMVGENFDVGVTDGVRATTYQLPTNGNALYCPAVEVETSVGSGVYEAYPNAGSRTALLANVATDALRGRWCWINAATGLVRFGSDGTNATGGHCPTAGRKVRVPSIFLTNCTAAAPTANVLPNATMTTRYEFATTGGCIVDMSRVSCAWYLNLAQAFSVRLNKVTTFDSIIWSECASPIYWFSVTVGQSAALSFYAINSSLNFAGGVMDKCTWTRASQAVSSTYITNWADCAGFTVTNERNHSLTKAANAAAGSTQLSRVADSTWTNTTLGGGSVLANTCNNVLHKDSIYYDHPALTTGTAIPMWAFLHSTGCIDCTVDGVTFGGLPMVQPYNGIFSFSNAGCVGSKVRNLGTPAAPLDLGGAQVDATWAQVTTTATVTQDLAHGLKVGDLLYVKISSNTTSVPVGSKTVLAVPTADTFTFTCVTGSLTGQTLTYYPLVSNQLAAIGGGRDVKIQRCYTTHTRTFPVGGDNSAKGVLLESVFGDDVQSMQVPFLNASCKMLMCTSALTAQVSCYGSHWLDMYTTGTPADTAGIAWTRVTTTATVTSAGHTLRTGDLIEVKVTSDAAAIPLGVKAAITATTSNTFTFACTNAGATSGTLTMAVLNGRIAVLMNEPTAETLEQVALTNGASFTSAGTLYMPSVGQSITLETPYYLRGHGQFANSAAIMAGGTVANYRFEYAIDKNDGNGFSSMTAAAYTAATLATALSGLTGLNAQTGFRLKLKISTTTANVTAISSVYLLTITTAADRAATYPLDEVTLSLTGLPSGSDITVIAAGTEAVRENTEDFAGTTYTYVYADPGTLVDIVVIKPGFMPYDIRNFQLPTSAASLPIALTPDPSKL